MGQGEPVSPVHFTTNRRHRFVFGMDLKFIVFNIFQSILKFFYRFGLLAFEGL